MMSQSTLTKLCAVLVGVVFALWLVSLVAFRPKLPTQSISMSEAKWESGVGEHFDVSSSASSLDSSGGQAEAPSSSAPMETAPEASEATRNFTVLDSSADAKPVPEAPLVFTANASSQEPPNIAHPSNETKETAHEATSLEPLNVTSTSNETKETAGHEAVNSTHEEWSSRLRIRASAASKEDQYFCTSMPVPRDHQTITAFTPRANMSTVHHMILYTCSSPPEPLNPIHIETEEGEDQVIWDCREEPVCVSGREVDPGKIVYAWARGASDFEAGEDTGFVVGTRAGINAAHIVLQTHFLKPSSEETENDVGEIEMRFSTKFPSKVLSMDLFANSRFRLPPKLESVDVKAKCCMQGGQSANLFAYRVHAHSYARNISLRVGDQVVAWGDPQQPHFFRKTAPDSPKLPFGSDWTATCTYNTEDSEAPIRDGQGHLQEMCNMYLMLSSHVPMSSFCLTDGGYTWNDFPSRELENPSMIDNRGSISTRLRVKQVVSEGLGQIAGVHLGYQGNPHHLLIFHRSNREMGPNDHKTRIVNDVLAVYDTKSQKVIETFGSNLFYLPHGLTIDRENNIWCTDVDSQQAYKLNPSGSLNLTVGVESERGSDEHHLCRPTEVAVSNYGNFFVSDGYCNERVVKYNKEGEVIGTFNLSNADIPHSILLDDCAETLLVADRENGLIRFVDANDGTESPPIDLSSKGKVYSITKDEYGTFYALVWDRDHTTRRVHFVQLSEASDLQQFKLESSFTIASVELPDIVRPHDFAVTYNYAEHSLDIFVGETGPGPHGKITHFSYTL